MCSKMSPTILGMIPLRSELSRTPFESEMGGREGGRETEREREGGEGGRGGREGRERSHNLAALWGYVTTTHTHKWRTESQ